MLDVRPTHWVTPLKEQPLDDLKPVVHVENFADEDCLVTGLVRIYRESTGTLVFDSVLLPTRVSGYQSADIPAESTWSPPAPADHDYFIICETKSFDNLERHTFNSNLGPRFFDIKPGPMGPAPAAHAQTHARGGMDELEVEDLATDNTNAGDVLTSVGDGSIRFSAPTGGAGTPSDTVTPETTPGQASNAGTATSYSRGDHTHGTPPSSGGVTDHGALTGLSDDDHTQYVLATGTRDITGPQKITCATLPELALQFSDATSEGALIIEHGSQFIGLFEAFGPSESRPSYQNTVAFTASVADTGKIIFLTNHSGYGIRLQINNDGKIAIGTDAPTALLDVNSDTLRLRTAKTPASASDTGNQGDICWDSNFLYVCVATNTWKRSTLSSW